MNYTTTYIVSGTGRFPIDMLRYDQSFPYSEYDSGVILKSLECGGDWKVTLGRHCFTKSWGPGIARWTSFGCSVIFD